MTNIAILGTGRIAGVMAETLQGMKKKAPDSICLHAVASREMGKAEEFARQYGFEKAYGSYGELARDEQTQLVYVATPHSQHYGNAKLCLENGKNVLCEKAFTVNAGQAAELCALAESKGLLLAEAIWTRYMPSYKRVAELLRSGLIGKPQMLTANLCYKIDQVRRIREPELAGGALLDVGVYPIHFAAHLFGHDVAKTDSTVVKMDTGVDAQESITLTYQDGRVAALTASASCVGDRRGAIFGDNGWLAVDNINNPAVITWCVGPNGKVESEAVPPQISGYEYQVEECLKAMEQGKCEPESMPHGETIRVMKLMDRLRAQWGLRYPCE